MKNKLQFSLLIYEVNQLHSEIAILEQLPRLIEQIRNRTILLGPTEGVLSVLFDGKELLGEAYWADIDFFVHDMFFSLPRLMNQEEIHLEMPETSTRIILKLDTENILYELRQKTQGNWETLTKSTIPSQLFVRQCIQFYFRIARIFAVLGEQFNVPSDFDVENPEDRKRIEEAIIGHNYADKLKRWQDLEPVQLLSNDEKEELGKLISMPLEQWVAQSDCNGE